ncbi:TBC1 domain family member 12 isoform X2 [Brachyhypopomus gauderio]|uniref:TBC1 domain family member 12 isoform X2 n=1 Tax=Brachyhypopomus gauderio TaxID=698409 RepID=UPI0040415DC7
MDRVDNGDSVLSLPVDVNENRDKTRACLISDRDASGPPTRLLSAARTQLHPPGSAPPAPGRAHGAGNGRNVNPFGVGLHTGRGTMLDLVAPRPAPCGHKRVCSEEGEHCGFNGFPEPPGDAVLGGGGDGGGGGGDGAARPSPTAAVSGAGPRRGDGMVPPDRVSWTSVLGSVAREAEDGLRPTNASVGKHRFDSSRSDLQTRSEMKIHNGDLDCVGMDDLQTAEPSVRRGNQQTFIRDVLFQHADGAVRLGHCGVLVVNSRSLCAGSTGGLPAPDRGVPLHPHQHIRSSTGPERNPAREDEAQRADTHDPDPGEEAVSDLSTKLSVSSIAENTVDHTEPEPPPADFSGAGITVRPQFLRTQPGYPVSLSCDATPLSPADDAGFFGSDGDADDVLGPGDGREVGRRQSAPEALAEGVCLDPDASSDQTATRRHGIAEFLTRSLFSWKPRGPKTIQTASGWKLFGKVPLKENTDKDTQQEYETKAVPEAGPHPRLQPMRRKNLEFEPLSTTGLILEDRPANLPAKSEEEAQRHRQEYNEMVAGAKRRELKEAQRKKRQVKERLQQEENITRAMLTWNTEVLPNWESMRNTRRVRDLWWQGLPPSVRGRVWSLAIGNELNITPELYEIFLSRAKERWRSFNETSSLDCGASLADRESSLDLIKLDIFRTFPSLYIFQKGGPYHDLLHSVLGAYTCYRPDVGYVQGMSFIAAVLILNLEEPDAFITFANLLNKPCQMAFFRVDHDLMLKYFAAFEVFFEENLPKLFQHFQTNSLTPDFYLIDWIFTLYSKSLPLDVACRVWDLFCRDGEEALFRTGLGILRLYQDVLLQMDFIHSAQFLSRLPEHTPAHTLFSCINNTHMISNNRRWNQVFSALMKDVPNDTDKAGSPARRS